MHLAIFGEYQQVAAEANERAGAKLRLFPHELAGRQFDATQVGAAAFPGVTMKAVNVALINNRGGVVSGDGVIEMPNFLRLALFCLKEERTKVVPAGEENVITRHNRICGVNIAGGLFTRWQMPVTMARFRIEAA